MVIMLLICYIHHVKMQLNDVMKVYSQPCIQYVQQIQSLSTANDNVLDNNAVAECMVGQKQTDYRVQHGFNCLEDNFGLDTKMANKSQNSVASSLQLVFYVPQAVGSKLAIKASTPLNLI